MLSRDMTEIILTKKIKQMEQRLIRLEGLVSPAPRPHQWSSVSSEERNIWKKTAGILGRHRADRLMRHVRSVRRAVGKRIATAH